MHRLPGDIRERLRVLPGSQCWVWTGQVNSWGYGEVKRQGVKHLIHRFVYELLVGPIPEGLTIDHVAKRGCVSKLCCNPAHLEPVTVRENVLRGDGPTARNARKTHCPQGHRYDAANTSRLKNGGRACRACGRTRYHARKLGLA